MFVLHPQLCYEVCGSILASKVAREAVQTFKNDKRFAPEVVAMLNDSLAEEDAAVSIHQSHMHMYASCSVYTSLQA